MRTVTFGRQFAKDLKRCRKRGLDLTKSEEVIERLMRDQPLPISCRPHKLVGQYVGLWECHISSDWLLIYALDEEGTSLDLIRMGSHADLFK